MEPVGRGRRSQSASAHSERDEILAGLEEIQELAGQLWGDIQGSWQYPEESSESIRELVEAIDERWQELKVRIGRFASRLESPE